MLPNQHPADYYITAPREIVEHCLGTLNENLLLLAKERGGVPGAPCDYYILNRASHPIGGGFTPVFLGFQKGNPADGINGISQEVLLAVVLDRLRVMQAGEFSCVHNAFAVELLKEALGWLQQRERERAKRGVSGLPVK
jgi:hypothetical protein